MNNARFYYLFELTSMSVEHTFFIHAMYSFSTNHCGFLIRLCCLILGLYKQKPGLWDGGGTDTGKKAAQDYQKQAGNWSSCGHSYLRIPQEGEE